MKDKNQPPGSGRLWALLLLWRLLVAQVYAWLPGPTHVHSLSSSSSWLASSQLYMSASSSSLVLSQDQEDLVAADEFAPLPPWLVWHHAGRRRNNVQDQWEDLQDQLLSQYDLDVDQVDQIRQTLHQVTGGDVQVMQGCLDFVELLLSMQDTESISNLQEDKTLFDSSFVSMETVLASIIHYVDCLRARQQGVYQQVAQMGTFGVSTRSKNQTAATINLPRLLGEGVNASMWNETTWEEDASNTTTNTAATPLEEDETSTTSSMATSLPPLVLQLADSAAVIKRAEILSEVLLAQSTTKNDYDSIRSLLVSVTDDWRALAIRCLASLYRLQGILWNPCMQRSRQVIQAAKQGLSIYAGLAQRLGMHHLKQEIEAAAFEILYPRQYSAVSKLLQEHYESLVAPAVLEVLQSQIRRTLYLDSLLMSNVERIQVSGRVKEPYSFWRKILKKRFTDKNSRRDLSVLDVPDGIALRVIVQPRRFPEDEGASLETLRGREHLLCYYIQDVLLQKYPPLDMNRMKDYIANPKPNGYQSLQYTSSIVRNGQSIPFELQIRSESMHRVAEFGLAAHWDYKLSGGVAGAPQLTQTMPLPALPASQSAMSTVPSKNEHKSQTTVPVDYIDALTIRKDAMRKSTVRVFFVGRQESMLESRRMGELIALEAGKTVRDLMLELDLKPNQVWGENKSLGLEVWRNGHRCMHPDQVVSNGDVILLVNKTEESVDPEYVLEGVGG